MKKKKHGIQANNRSCTNGKLLEIKVDFPYDINQNAIH